MLGGDYFLTIRSMPSRDSSTHFKLSTSPKFLFFKSSATCMDHLQMESQETSLQKQAYLKPITALNNMKTQ